MTGTVIAFNCRKVAGNFRLMILRISNTADPSELLTHPCDDPDTPLRAQIQLPKYLLRLHGHNYTGPIIDGASSQVPGIEMSRDDNNLFLLLAAFEVSDEVVANSVRERLWCESQVQEHGPLFT